MAKKENRPPAEEQSKLQSESPRKAANEIEVVRKRWYPVQKSGRCGFEAKSLGQT